MCSGPKLLHGPTSSLSDGLFRRLPQSVLWKETKWLRKISKVVSPPQSFYRRSSFTAEKGLSMSKPAGWPETILKQMQIFSIHKNLKLSGYRSLQYLSYDGGTCQVVKSSVYCHAIEKWNMKLHPLRTQEESSWIRPKAYLATHPVSHSGQWEAYKKLTSKTGYIATLFPHQLSGTLHRTVEVTDSQGRQLPFLQKKYLMPKQCDKDPLTGQDLVSQFHSCFEGYWKWKDCFWITIIHIDLIWPFWYN